MSWRINHVQILVTTSLAQNSRVQVFMKLFLSLPVYSCYFGCTCNYLTPYVQILVPTCKYLYPRANTRTLGPVSLRLKFLTSNQNKHSAMKKWTRSARSTIHLESEYYIYDSNVLLRQIFNDLD